MVKVRVMKIFIIVIIWVKFLDLNDNELLDFFLEFYIDCEN